MNREFKCNVRNKEYLIRVKAPAPGFFNKNESYILEVADAKTNERLSTHTFPVDVEEYMKTEGKDFIEFLMGFARYLIDKMGEGKGITS